MTNALQGLEFSTINSIARSYNYNEDYKFWVQKVIVDNITQISHDVKTREVLNSIESWYDIIAKEEELINQYKRTLQELNKYKTRKFADKI